MDVEKFKQAAGISLMLAKKWHPHVVAAMDRFGIDTPLRQAAFIAQLGTESAGFTAVVESFNYSVDGLRATFGKRMPFSMAAKLGRQLGERTVPVERQMQIANMLYGGRYGNRPDEGWKFRGRGLKQVTFKANYDSCGNALGIDLILNPDLLLEDKYAALSAGWFWSANGLNKFADVEDTVGLSKVVNGGTNGLTDRKFRYAAARRILVG